MPTFRMTLEYEGSRFHGWQAQSQGLTLQGVLEEALERLTGAPTRVVAAGRTDAGVHALGQVVSFATARRLSPEAWKGALNALLPPDIVVREVREAPEGFDARRWATGKLYRYDILARTIPSPFLRKRAWWVPWHLQVEAMREAAALLLGTHDFSAVRAAGCGAKHPVRTLRRADLAVEGDLIRCGFEGDGFLRMMVRNIVGTLVEVGRGRLRPGAVGEILSTKDRRLAGPTAPPDGLYLVEVYYDSRLIQTC
ncbi:MAG: tRNA pseudouridine(38-40) synthase TruA [Nitrospirae bacterium]|nr:tRNA pseudouridine(38-40) synthase TruA [Nitrospirota bacterium]